MQVELTRVGGTGGPTGQRVNGSTVSILAFFVPCPVDTMLEQTSHPHGRVFGFWLGLGPSLVGELEVEVDFDFNFGSKVGGKCEGEGLH